MEERKLIWIRSLSLIGVLPSIYLVIMELRTGTFCPRLVRIPACYLVLVAYLAIHLSTYLKSSSLARSLQLTGVLSAWLMAIWFSVGKLAEFSDCPVLLGIPLCYASLLLSTLLLALIAPRR